eukprot:scaffold3.g6400.t1
MLIAAGVAATAIGLWWACRMGYAHSKDEGVHRVAPAPPATLPPPEKVGAGFLFCCQGEVLVLRRTSRNNHGTWGLPGGNADPEDAGNLLETALREAREEVGGVPAHTVLDSIETRRGERLQKSYTVFLAAVPPKARAVWRPALNEEHSEWAWVPLAELGASGRELHPVVKKLLKQSRQRTLDAVARS